MAAEDTVVSTVEFRFMSETEPLYTAAGVQTLLAQERNAAVNREQELGQELRDLIGQNDECFDDMCTALNGVVDLSDLDSDNSSLRAVISRVNTLTKCLQLLREGIMD